MITGLAAAAITPAGGTVARDSHADAAPEPPALRALRQHVLGVLADGAPRTIAEIPRRWPLMHAHVAAAVLLLVAEGVVEPVRVGRRAAYTTGPGTRLCPDPLSPRGPDVTFTPRRA